MALFGGEKLQILDRNNRDAFGRATKEESKEVVSATPPALTGRIWLPGEGRVIRLGFSGYASRFTAPPRTPRVARALTSWVNTLELRIIVVGFELLSDAPWMAAVEMLPYDEQ